MATLQEQARALGDPTRHTIFRVVAGAGAPVEIAELTARTDVSHNAVRQHLAKLVRAGLLVEATAKGAGPGRPRLCYELAPAAEERWGVVGPYERLSLLLAEITRTDDPAEAVGERAGRQARRVATGGTDPVDALAQAMARLGFEPEVQGRGRDREIVLTACPFAAAVLVDADTVCALHLGMARGLAAGGDVVVDELVVNDPRQARCRLRLTVAPSDGPVRPNPNRDPEPERDPERGGSRCLIEHSPPKDRTRSS